MSRNIRDLLHQPKTPLKLNSNLKEEVLEFDEANEGEVLIELDLTPNFLKEENFEQTW